MKRFFLINCIIAFLLLCATLLLSFYRNYYNGSVFFLSGGYALVSLVLCVAGYLGLNHIENDRIESNPGFALVKLICSLVFFILQVLLVSTLANDYVRIDWLKYVVTFLFIVEGCLIGVSFAKDKIGKTKDTSM